MHMLKSSLGQTKRTMITLYQLKTNTNAQLANMAASNASGFLGVNISAFRFKLHF